MSVSQARNAFPQIVAEVAKSGEPVTVSRYGKPLVVITPVTNTETSVHPLRGLPLVVAKDFDATLDHYWGALDDDTSICHAAEEPKTYGTKSIARH